jgi:hypothetical protein
MPQIAPALSEADFVVLLALAQAAEAIVLTRGTLPKTQLAVEHLQHVIEIERHRQDEAAAKAKVKAESGRREHEENCRRWGVPI